MNIDTLVGISSIFDKNIGRVRNLISIFYLLTTKKRRKQSTKETDLLRVAIMLLHSSMEDYLRSILKIKLPEIGTKEVLKKIPLLSSDPNQDRRNTKFDFSELIEYKEITIQKIIEQSVEKYLDEVSFNDVKDITTNLSSININLSQELRNGYYPILTQMIKRRHCIVHEADRYISPDYRIRSTKPINVKTVENYVDTVDKFMNEIRKILESQIA